MFDHLAGAEQCASRILFLSVLLIWWVRMQRAEASANFGDSHCSYLGPTPKQSWKQPFKTGFLSGNCCGWDVNNEWKKKMIRGRATWMMDKVANSRAAAISVQTFSKECCHNAFFENWHKLWIYAIERNCRRWEGRKVARNTTRCNAVSLSCHGKCNNWMKTVFVYFTKLRNFYGVLISRLYFDN